ncbi:MAG TPA: ABC transporter substrate-binding protein [Longimicrobiaceae bacterium]|nr:ABC transporter substrate-binding protein [Longimicrobiaceae bacterium]
MIRIARSWFRSALVLGALGVGAACGDRGAEEGSAVKGAAGKGSEQAERGGTAIVAELADVDKPHPIVAESVQDGDMVDVMYMPLLRGAWRDGRPAYLTSHDSPMALAWHWEYAGPDSSAIRYRMRSGLKWSDGEPITARDVVWTYDMIRDPRVASPRQDYVSQLDSVVAENDSTVTFHFKRRYPEMLHHSGIPIAPRHAYEGSDPSQLRTHRRLLSPENGNMVVSGPFMVGSWRRGQELTLVPNPHFPVRPHLDRIVRRVVPETTTRVVELQTGKVDFARPIPADQVPQIRAQTPNVRFEQEEKRYYDYIAYNPRAFDAFADPEIRRALGLAIDVPGLIRALQMEEIAVPAAGPYSPIFSQLYDPQRNPPLPYDPEQARRILEAKGWRDTNGDGIREKDGKPFRFTLLTNSGNQRRSDIQQVVQQQWKQIGVDARLQQMEFNTFMDRLTNKKFEAAVGNWGVALSPDLTELWGRDAKFNFVSYENPRVTQLFQQALEQPTEAAAVPYWKAAAEQISNDQPYTFLFYFDQLDGVNNRLRGIEVDTYGAYQNTWEWWIPKDQQRSGQRADTARGADTAR